MDSDRTGRAGRLLLIAYEMPPRWGPHALRIAYFCKELHALGWEIDAIGCAPWEGLEDQALLEKIPPQVNVHRIPQKQTGGALSSLLWTLRAAGKGWRIAKKRRPDVILSSAPQYISVMAGYLLALVSRIPWVADFGDPFSGHVGYKRSRVKSRISLFIERLWLRQAAYYVLVTEGAREYFEKNFPRKKAKTALVPLGYDPADEKFFLQNPPTDRFRIAFAGSLHLGMSDGPQEFFKAVVASCRAHPEIRGKMRIDIITRNPAQRIMQEIVPADLQEIFCFHSHLDDMGKVFEILSASSCLLIWGFHGGLQIPSKLFVYFGLKKPILAILCNPQDPLRDLIECNRRGVVVVNDSRLIAAALADLFFQDADHSLADLFSRDELTMFTWPSLVAQLSGILQSLRRRD